jgi:hypothetical protein
MASASALAITALRRLDLSMLAASLRRDRSMGTVKDEVARGRGKPMPVPHQRTSYPCDLRQAMRPQTAWPPGCSPAPADGQHRERLTPLAPAALGEKSLDEIVI